jgi:hypothetical protein
MKTSIAAVCVKCSARSLLDVGAPPPGKTALSTQIWCCPWCHATNQTEARGHLVQVSRLGSRTDRQVGITGNEAIAPT